MSSPSSSPRTLPGGLVLRIARPDELDQIGALLTARGDAEDAVDHRLVVQDPDLGWQACAVVVDGDRVVSTATLLDETVRLEDVLLPAGQVELVATDPDYEGRGLVRALMDWAHTRSAERGHLLQVMIGIPYFYRLFGYAYAIDIPPARPLVGAAPAGDSTGDGVLREATAADLPALVGLQDAAQAGADVAVPHPAARWRALLAQSATRTLVLDRAGVVVATARVRDDDEDGVLVAEPAAVDEAAAHGLLAALAIDGRDLTVVHRDGTVTGAAWDEVLGEPDVAAEQYYVRIADPAALLDALRPVLERRIAAAGLGGAGLGLGRDGTPREALVLSTFGAHYRLPWVDGGLGPVEVGGPMQSPGVHGGLGVAPDQLGALLFGQRGFAGLRRLRPDVYGDPALGEGLFPPVRADVLSYYLPW